MIEMFANLLFTIFKAVVQSYKPPSSVGIFLSISMYYYTYYMTAQVNIRGQQCHVLDGKSKE